MRAGYHLGLAATSLRLQSGGRGMSSGYAKTICGKRFASDRLCR